MSTQQSLPNGVEETFFKLCPVPHLDGQACDEMDIVHGALCSRLLVNFDHDATVMYITNRCLHATYKDLRADGFLRLRHHSLWLHGESVNACLDALVQHYNTTSPPSVQWTFVDTVTITYNAGFQTNVAFEQALRSTGNVFVAVHEHHHFYLIIADVKKRSILVVDSFLQDINILRSRVGSLPQLTKRCVRVLEAYGVKVNEDDNTWVARIGKPHHATLDACVIEFIDDNVDVFDEHVLVPQQPDFYDCGCFTVAFAECILRGVPLEVVEHYDMVWYRKYMCWIIWRFWAHGLFKEFPPVKRWGTLGSPVVV